MRRAILHILVGSAIYGFAAGSGGGAKIATWNLVKFPLLILVTSAICSLAYVAFAQVIARRLGPRDVLTAALRTFGDLSVLLASMAPPTYFLARTFGQPTLTTLNEYPFFLGLNVVFIACCGAAALARQTLRLCREYALTKKRSLAVLGVWIAVSLFAGGQCAWFLRPFYGCSTITKKRFIEGTHPDFRGATSFYEAVYNLVNAPPLASDYYIRGREDWSEK